MHITIVITFYVLLGHNKKRYKICLGSGRLFIFFVGYALFSFLECSTLLYDRNTLACLIGFNGRISQLKSAKT
jgi:hypothetical protein